MDKPSGWYYVGDGTLRFRDDYGWTEYYMDTNDPRAQIWPPPPPRTMLQQLRDEERTASGKVPRRRAVLRGRRSRSV